MGENRIRENVGIMMNLDDFLKNALYEDVGRGDLFALVEPKTLVTAELIAKSEGVFAGKKYIQRLSELENFDIEWFIEDGETFENKKLLCIIKGDSHTVLRCERTALNIALHASSIATLTKKYVDIIKPYGTKLLDTRKTRPGLRIFGKYATRCAGAINHRMGLDDSLMIKDTHLKTIDNLEKYIKKARTKIPFTAKIEIEAETLEIAKNAFKAGADIVMCDNMTPNEVKEVVSYRNKHYPHILLEASGNISLDTIEEYAKTKVDAISSGSLIHQANWIDISMKIF